ncbi:MAG: sodium:proton antiporter [Candidatus Dormibacteraeota bacterium]|nr:sodium:proton antiporter [Candidatus Dormibacteraeota bacterium]MBO0744231.1 sodium:proton antiporter [Candidatus Dormibacteraeota bacterium]
MSAGVRRILFAVGGVPLAGLLAFGISGLPGFGHYPGPYGQIVSKLSVPERNATDVVTAVNLDLRGLDTMGEEFILFISVTAVAVLLRRQARETEESGEDEKPGRTSPARDDGLLLFGVALASVVVLFGLYLVSHGQLTPGGGFQGGAVLASALLLIYLVAGYPAFKRLAPVELLELGDGVGAAGFVVVGLAAVAVGAVFLENFLPRGERGLITSAGTMPVIYLFVGLEVATGFALVLAEFLEQLNVVKEG